jgi:hypothetical protein
MLPTFKRFNVGDFKDAPTWLTKIIVGVNSFMQQVYNLLNGRLTFAENIQAELVTLVKRAPFTGFSINTKLPVVTGVLLLGVDGPTFSTAPVLRTRQDGTSIIIEDLTGLVSGEKYTIRILVI